MEGHHDPLSEVEPGDTLPERNDLGHELVAKREGTLEGGLSSNDGTVQIAAPDSDRADDGLVRPLQSRVRRLPPIEHARANEDELSHLTVRAPCLALSHFRTEA